MPRVSRRRWMEDGKSSKPNLNRRQASPRQLYGRGFGLRLLLLPETRYQWGVRFVVLFRIRVFPVVMAAGLSAGRLSAQNPAPLGPQLELAEKADDKAAVLEIARRAAAAAPDDPKAVRREIEAYLAAGEAQRAATVLDIAAKRPALAPVVDELRGDVAAANAQPDAAYAAWKRAIASASDPTRRPNIWRKIAKLGSETNHFAWTVEALRNLPPGAEAKAQLAVALLQRGDFENSVAEIQAANRIDASAPNVKSNLPRFEALQRQLPAIQPILARLKTNPRDPDALLERATWLALYGANVAALADADEVSKIDPGSKGALLLRGLLLRKLGRTSQAEGLRVAAIGDEARFLNKLLAVLRATDATLRMKPDATAEARRAANLLAANQPLLAAEAAAAALKLDAKSAAGALIAGQAASQLGHRAEAMRLAKLATENNPRDAEAWAFLAQLQRRRAELDLAIASFTKAITLDAKDYDSLRSREACFRTLGRDAEADRDRDAQLRLRPAAASSPKEDQSANLAGTSR